MSINSRKRKDGYTPTTTAPRHIEINLNDLNTKIEALMQVSLMQGALGVLLLLRGGALLTEEAVGDMIDEAQARIFEYGPKTGASFSVPGWEPLIDDVFTAVTDDAIGMVADEEQEVVKDDMEDGEQNDA